MSFNSSVGQDYAFEIMGFKRARKDAHLRFWCFRHMNKKRWWIIFLVVGVMLTGIVISESILKFVNNRGLSFSEVRSIDKQMTDEAQGNRKMRTCDLEEVKKEGDRVAGWFSDKLSQKGTEYTFTGADGCVYNLSEKILQDAKLILGEDIEIRDIVYLNQGMKFIISFSFLSGKEESRDGVAVGKYDFNVEKNSFKIIKRYDGNVYINGFDVLKYSSASLIAYRVDYVGDCSDEKSCTALVREIEKVCSKFSLGVYIYDYKNDQLKLIIDKCKPENYFR